MTPQAKEIQALLQGRGEEIINDHVAFRTFDIQGFGLETVTDLLAEIGYERFDSYVFPDKHLRAHAYKVPNDHDAPKIFSVNSCEPNWIQIPRQLSRRSRRFLRVN